MTEGDIPAETSRQRYRRILTQGENTERTVFFSDAVMAIAMTVLVLEIRIPEVDQIADLPRALVEKDLNGLIGYMIAFLLIGINWLSHHRKFTVIERYDGRLHVLNLAYLFFIALLPLPVSIFAEYGPATISVALYAFFIAAPSACQLLIWVHAWRANLFSPVVDVGMYRTVRRSLYPVILVFSLSIVVSVTLGATIAMYSWFLVVPATLVAERWRSKEERRGEHS